MVSNEKKSSLIDVLNSAGFDVVSLQDNNGMYPTPTAVSTNLLTITVKEKEV